MFGLARFLPNDYPAFWLRRGFMARILLPLSAVYVGLGLLRRCFVRSVAVDIPVVCVGNLSIGGVGKTPVVAALVAALQDQGITVHILAHGYGGTLKDITRVDLARYYAMDVGDEALLHAAIAPTWIGQDRALSAQAAQQSGADLLILDDGWQNPRLKKDFVLAVVNADAPFDNGYIFPAGPLRQKPQVLSTADAVIAIGAELDAALDDVSAVHACRVGTWDMKSAQAVFAFCALGRSGQFVQTVSELCQDSAIDFAGFLAYPDHQHWTAEILQEITISAGSARLVTSKKDWVRLPKEWQDKTAIIQLHLAWTQEEEFQQLCLKIGNLAK